MKLRNKKTGEIWNLRCYNEGSNDIIFVSNGFQNYDINTIKQLADTFEDVEPEEVWYIDYQGVIRSASKEENNWFKENEIGNCFETKEEAEKAVEKLKAWKRLKDKGFKFCKYSALAYGEIDFRIPDFESWDDSDNEQVKHDLDLLFGGEE